MLGGESWRAARTTRRARKEPGWERGCVWPQRVDPPRRKLQTPCFGGQASQRAQEQPRPDLRLPSQLQAGTRDRTDSGRVRARMDPRAPTDASRLGCREGGVGRHGDNQSGDEGAAKHYGLSSTPPATPPRIQPANPRCASGERQAHTPGATGLPSRSPRGGTSAYRPLSVLSPSGSSPGRVTPNRRAESTTSNLCVSGWLTWYSNLMGPTPGA
jgi:hypothetical protein